MSTSDKILALRNEADRLSNEARIEGQNATFYFGQGNHRLGWLASERAGELNASAARKNEQADKIAERHFAVFAK